MKVIVIIIIGMWLVLLTGCRQQPSKYLEKIHALNAFIETRPDSVWQELKELPTDSLRGEEERAAYALLLSMALDKNVVDTTEFDVLQPAIDYYEHHGTPTDKLRTNYYRARIHQNRGEDTQALNYFLQALEVGEASEDILTKARSYFAQSFIYSSMHELDKELEATLLAANYFKKAGRIESYANSLDGAINTYFLKEDSKNCLKCIELFKELPVSSFSLTLQESFYSNCLMFASVYSTKEETLRLLEKYFEQIPKMQIDWLSVSSVYEELGDYSKAYEAVCRYRPEARNDRNVRYYALRMAICDKVGRYKESAQYRRIYQYVTDSISMAHDRQGTRFVPARRELELQTQLEQEAKVRLALMAVIVVLALLAVLVWVYNRLKFIRTRARLTEQQAETNRLQVEQLREEQTRLMELLDRGNGLNEEARASVGRQLALLNKLLKSYITGEEPDVRAADRELTELVADRERLMNALRNSFSTSHREFIDGLRSRTLNDEEIGYCCLYALGLRGKEVGAYLQKGNLYNISSTIRKKLGLDGHDTNLGIYLRKLLSGELPFKAK